ncbi:MAG: flagellin lysine-N-methylase [Clostridia bacterium]|nr:flagellin lysine-N-methylase [Clostridia bacterium]
MITIKPDFYKDFKCIADKCTDSCCIGWEIVVDRETSEKYQNIKGDFGEKIRANLVKDEDNEICFKLDENERCPFLNKDNLCDIIINCGENALCGICREHPRFYNESSESLECGLGLCCEEVCRLLLETDEPLEYLTEVVSEDENSIDFYPEDEEYIELYNVRAKMFEILNSDMNFDEKIIVLKVMTEEIINEKFVFDSDGVILKRYEKTEPINKEWTEYFNSLKNNIGDYLKKEKPFDEATNGDKKYSKILSYIMFRHLSNSVYSDNADLKEYFNFCISAVRFIKLCDIKTFCETNKLTLKDRIENVKRWSKQIEYSDLNVDILIFKN